MNRLDRRIYKALSFFANNTRAEVTVIFENTREAYENNVPEDIMRYISEAEYIDSQGQSRFMINYKGLEELRKLEAIEDRDKQLWYATFGLIIAFIAITISIFGLIG